MRTKAFSYRTCAAVTLSLTVGAGIVGANAASKGTAVPLTTPPGITLIDVTNNQQQLIWRRLGDASGKPLYTYDQDSPGKSTCVDACAQEFPPLIAPRGAVAFDAWTLISRGGNVQQWAYDGRPLYRYSGQDPVGNLASGRETSSEEAAKAAMDFGSSNYSPKQGWKRAAYQPEKATPTPAGIELQSLSVANGYAMVVSGTGMVMYVMDGAPKQPRMWAPVYAPGAARAMGDFTIVTREDSTRQWAYKGQPLYTYYGDYSPGDVNGAAENKEAKVALAFQHFAPQGISVNIVPLRGPMMTNAKGLTVYTQSRQKLQYGGRQSRGGYRYSYDDAKAVGTQGCVDACLKEYRPVEAPRGAQSSGFWEVVTRDDGTRQWAYRGSPLYTYVDDKLPGDVLGNNRHVIIYGDPTGKRDLALTGGDKVEANSLYGAFGSGLYWHTVGLHN